MVSGPKFLQPKSCTPADGQPQPAQWKGPVPPVSKPHLQLKLYHDSHGELRVGTTILFS